MFRNAVYNCTLQANKSNLHRSPKDYQGEIRNGKQNRKRTFLFGRAQLKGSPKKRHLDQRLIKQRPDRGHLRRTRSSNICRGRDLGSRWHQRYLQNKSIATRNQGDEKAMTTKKLLNYFRRDMVEVWR